MAAALLLTGVAVYVGLQSSSPEQAAQGPTASPTPSPTPLASLDLSGLPIARAPACDAIDEGDVEDALGGPVSGTDHYDSGQRVVLAPGLRDVSHEFGCIFRAATGAQARVWVFAEPVSGRVAKTLVRDARSEKGCRPVSSGPTFGTPSATLLCALRKPRSRQVTLRGLFGDAWLSCQLTSPAAGSVAATVRRSEQWCVRVATTLGARP